MEVALRIFISLVFLPFFVGDPFLSCKSCGTEMKIDLAVKKYSDVSKVNHAKSLLFFPLGSLATRLDKFSNGLERLETWLKPRSSKFLRIENQASSIELWETVNLHLSGTVLKFFRGLKISGKILSRYELSRDSRESILGLVVCKFILLVFSGGDSLLFCSCLHG